MKVIIFDLFGTLVDNFGSSAERMGRELAAALGAPYEAFISLWNETLPMRIIGDFDTVEANLDYVCRGIGIRPQADQIEDAVEIRMKYVREALKPKPDAIDASSQLKNQGYRLGLISNCSPEIAVLWPETPFAQVIDLPVFSCRAHLKKPDPRIYHLACEQLHVAPDSCLYVGDGEDYELTTAARVGLHAVLIRRSPQLGPSHREAREWQGPTIAKLTEVLRLAS